MDVRRAAMPNLEMRVWRQVGIGDSDATNHLTLGHGLLLPDVGTIQRAVDRIVAAAVIDDHRQPIGAELSDTDDPSVGDTRLFPTLALMPAIPAIAVFRRLRFSRCRRASHHCG
jgi:hypothetical protein